MNFDVFCVYDRKAGIYQNVWLSVNDNTAKREFVQLMSKSPFADDFEFYCLGSFNQVTGQMIGFDKPVFVCAFNAMEKGDEKAEE